MILYCLIFTGFRLLNPKAVSSVEKWKKVSNSNIVPLKEAFSSKAFNDTCEYLKYHLHFVDTVCNNRIFLHQR